MPRLILFGAAACSAVAAWLSQGTLAYATPDGPRIALLPWSAPALVVTAAVGGAVFLLGRAGAALTPLWLLGLVLLPWAPLGVPPALLTWSGALGLLVWIAVAVLMVASLPSRREAAPVRVPARYVLPLVHSRPALAAGLLSLLIFGSAAWRSAPSVPGGDEPHYLVITQSLLRDGDLRIEDNHRRGDYRLYFPGALEPHYLRRGRDGEIYSIHAPGISVFVAPAFATGGYPAVVLFLVCVAAIGGALTWHVTWLATRNRQSAWFGWAAVSLSATTIFHSFTVYPDGVGGLVVLTGVWALLRADQERENGVTATRPWAWHGGALAILPWLHSRFAVLAISLGVLVLLRLGRTRNARAKAVAFLAVPAVGALGWIGYFVAIYGTPNPAAPYGNLREFSVAFIPGGLGGLLFDQRFGLIANAPVLIFGVVGLFLMLAFRQPAGRTSDAQDPPGPRRLGFELAFIVVPYLLTATQYAMWWGGSSAPARLAAAVVPPLAIPCAFAWRQLTRPATRATAAGALGLTVFISAVLIVPERGRLAFNTRDSYALWLDWSSRLTDLGRGLPAWFRGQEERFFGDVMIWAALILAAWGILRSLDRLPALRVHHVFGTIAFCTYAVAAMAAASLVWRMQGSEGTAARAAQVDYVRRMATERRLLALQVNPPRVLNLTRVAGMIRIDGRPRTVGSGAAGADDRPLLNLPWMPAGRYRVRPDVEDGGGSLMVGIGQDQVALVAEPIAGASRPIIVDFPVDVRAVVVRGDEDARRVVRWAALEPISIVAAENRLTRDYARRAARYGDTIVFFLDDRSFPEPEAFWVGGARSSSIVIQPSRPAAVTLYLQNAPVENRIRIESTPWVEDLHLAPGEERRIRVPLDPRRGATLLTFEVGSGFRPSLLDPENTDHRFLGVRVKVE